MGRDRASSSSVYVGNLPPDFRDRDIEDLFNKYGRIKFVDVKNRPQRGSPYAFVEYDDPRDADDAVRGRDGYDVDGYRLRVEVTRGAGPRGPGGRPIFGGGSGGGSSSGGSRRGGGGRPTRRGFAVHVSGLPSSGSWQDLKDHMRDAGDVIFADVHRDGTGVVEFARQDDMKYAVKKFDDVKFTSHEGESAYIRVRESSASRSRSRSPRGRGRDDRNSPRYSRSHSRSRSPHSRSRSPL